MKHNTLLLLGLTLGLVGTTAGVVTGRSRAAQRTTEAPVVAGLDLNQWPQHCRKLRRSLPQQVVYDPRPAQPFVAPAWKLQWQGTTLAIPAVDYRELSIFRQQNGEFVLALQAKDPHGELISIVLSHAPGQPPIEDVRVASGVFNGLEESTLVGRRNVQRGKLLTQRLFDGPVSEDEILELSYQHQSQDLTCQIDQWEAELPIAIALDLRQQEADTVVAAYPSVGRHAGRVIRHRRPLGSQATGSQATGSQTKQTGSPEGRYRRGKGREIARYQTQWQVQLNHSSSQRSEVWVSLPEHHISAQVGLGMGQNNWWEAQGRPVWLNTMETALALETNLAGETAGAAEESAEATGVVWQKLARELEQANFSSNSVRSAQEVATALEAES